MGEILRRAKLTGLTYPLPTGMTEAGVEALLYPPSAPSKTLRPEPDWPGVLRELRRKGMTLDLLWQENKGEHPDGYQNSRFCDHYRVWAGRLSLSLRQTHTPGEKLFVDYAGPTVPVTDPLTGEIRQAAIFCCAWCLELTEHYYSVPFRFARQKVDARFSVTTVELFHRGSRIASHVRNPAKGRHTTRCPHDHGPDLLASGARQRAWSALPPLT